MADDRNVLREVAWREVFPWLLLLRTFRLSVDLRKLFLAAVATLLVGAGWWLLDQVVGSPIPSDVPRDEPLWEALLGPFSQLSALDLTWGEFCYYLAGGAWTVAVWALCGGMISRIAAVELAAEERLPLGAALRHACRKWFSYFGAPLFPLLGVLLAIVPLALLGLVIRSDVGLIVGGLGWPMALAAGAFMTTLVLGVALGWPLMWSTISVEGTDGFDALSRSYSYVFQRPLLYFFYTSIAVVVGWLGWIAVWVFVTAMVHFATWGAGWGAGAENAAELPGLRPRLPEFVTSLVPLPTAPESPAPAPDSIRAAGVKVVGFWVAVVKSLVLGYVASFFWTASVAVYLLLRSDVDATELDEVFLEHQEDLFGLPEIRTDERGAPIVVEPAAAENKPTPGDPAARVLAPDHREAE